MVQSVRFLARIFAASFCAFVMAAGAFAADEERVVYTDPENAGPYYELQGEYAGDVETGEGTLSVGAQVIALGDGAFDIIGYHGGLPGAGWDKSDRVEFSGRLEGDAIHAEHGNIELKISDGKIDIFYEGRPVGVEEKVERTSKTMGAEPPEGAVVLFDGKNADAFSGGEMTDDGLLKADCETKKKWGDHQLHIEFRTPFVPDARGQERGNSGVYVQGRYECQVLDSFGLTGENNECGGFYQVAKPSVNMCFPPLTWQTYDIDFTAAKYNDAGEKTENARVTVKHNGVVIHDDLELPHGTPGRYEEAPGPQAIYLQGHGNPVVYRNIWVVEK